MEKAQQSFKNFEDYPISVSDYLDLWKYFHDRVNALKGSLTTFVTWLLAFNSAILGFMVQQKFISFNCLPKWLEQPISTMIFSFGGIVVCIYCLYLIHDYGKSINENWWSAEQVKTKIIPLEEIHPSMIKAAEYVKDMPTPPLCRDLRRVVVGFLIINGFILFWSVGINILCL